MEIESSPEKTPQKRQSLQSSVESTPEKSPVKKQHYAPVPPVLKLPSLVSPKSSSTPSTSRKSPVKRPLQAQMPETPKTGKPITGIYWYRQGSSFV